MAEGPHGEDARGCGGITAVPVQSVARTADLGGPTQYAHHFDPQRRAAQCSPLKAALEALCATLESREAALGIRQRRRSPAARMGFRLAVEAIACNILTGATLLGRGRACEVAVPRSHAAIYPPARYRPRVYGEHFLAALDLMAHPEVGLIEPAGKGYRYPGSEGRRSTIRATSGFWECIPPDLMERGALTREPPREVLILRERRDPTTGEAADIDYKDNPWTKRWRNEMKNLNARLEAAPIIVLPGATALRDDEGQPIDPTRRTLRRIFNNGSWHEGGRLYDGFWENMRRSNRCDFLRIGTAEHPEGERIANVDYGQLFPRLAYLSCYREPPEEWDLYDIAGTGQHRDGYKQLLNALLCASELPTRWPLKARRAFPPGAKLRDHVAAIRKRHAAIAHLFGSGSGMRLMVQESTILVATVLRLFGSGITALPLHDSVLVAASQADAAKAVMEEEFAALIGTGGANVTISYC